MFSSVDTRAPKVAIIGRPNVGKSTLFNVLVRSRRALVKNEAGVTRDIIIEPTEWWGKKFDVVDTGGLTEAKDIISKLIREQVVKLIADFDLLVVVLDGRSGLVPEDRDVVRLAQASGRPFVVVVNKVDQAHQADIVLSEFYEFGEDVIPCSFEKRENVDNVVEWILQNLPSESHTQNVGVRLAIVGKPNVGKSSICNFLLGEKRLLVSSMAGTTMDSVEVPFEYGGENYILVDTAGLRKPSKRKQGLERISAVKSHGSIDRADIVLLMVDGREGVTHQDARMIEYIVERHKAIILVANKLDIAVEEREEYRKWFRQDVAKTLHFYPDIPIIFTSAKTGAGIKDLFDGISQMWEKLQTRISTSKLNDFFYSAIRAAPAPVYGSKDVKFYYLTQTHQKPPSFIAFANHPEGVTPSYRRFLAKQIKQNFQLEGVPVRIFVMGGSH